MPSSSHDTASHLHHKVANLVKLPARQLRLTNASDGSVIPFEQGLSTEAIGLGDQSVILVKDLGPQIAWRTVFVIEYLGPLLIHPLLYFLRPFIYTAPADYSLQPGALRTFPQPSTVQLLSLALTMIHFAKREAETLFVHRFSADTMPFFNVFKNSAHYWLLSGLNIAFWTYSPSSPTQNRSATSPVVLFGLLLFAYGEVGNLYAHLVLRNLRAEGTRERGIPRGFGFNWVTCPNYLFEILAWTGIWLVNWSWSTLVFNIVAGAQMAVWAQKKERNYRKQFGDKYKKKRFAMLPGIV